MCTHPLLSHLRLVPLPSVLIQLHEEVGAACAGVQACCVVEEAELDRHQRDVGVGLGLLQGECGCAMYRQALAMRAALALFHA